MCSDIPSWQLATDNILTSMCSVGQYLHVDSSNDDICVCKPPYQAPIAYGICMEELVFANLANVGLGHVEIPSYALY